MTRYSIALLGVTLLFAGLALADQSESAYREEKITAAASEHRLRLDYGNGLFFGPAWDRLVDEGRAAQFFLVGEEHGIAENPLLVAQLFTALSQHGYQKFAIEISPTMAWYLDEALEQDGMDGLRALFSEPGGEPAFFGMAEEAQMLAAVRAAAPAGRSVFWGTDYEIAGDRQLLKLLSMSWWLRPPHPGQSTKRLAPRNTFSVSQAIRRSCVPSVRPGQSRTRGVPLS